MHIDLLSLFPEYFRSPLEVSILKRAIESGKISVSLTDVRDFAEGKHRKVDDRPYGGGPGMVLMPGPVARAIRARRREDSHVVYMSPQGKLLSPAVCERLALCPHLVIVCGHYEGLDQRVIEKEVDEEISIGDYVLTNGCLASLVLLDAMVRFIPGVLGDEESAASDSFQQGVFKGPAYTRPEEFEGMKVPLVLQSGNHAAIKQWRCNQGAEKTGQVRPDLKGKEVT